MSSDTGQQRANFFPVCHSILSIEALVERVLPAYALGDVRSCRLLKRWIADTYAVESATGPSILRVYRAGWRSADEVASELLALTFLASKGVPVSAPIPRSDGTLLLKIEAPEGERYAALFSFAPGRSLYQQPAESRAACSRRYGELIGCVHRELEGYRPAGPRPRPGLDFLLEEPLRALEPYFASRPADWARLLGRCRALKAAIEQWAEKEEVQLIHGDVDPGNVHFMEDGAATLFDFDFLGLGWKAYDLAVPLWESQWARWDPQVATQFLEGYRTAQHLSEATLDLTRYLMPLRGVWFLGLVADNADQWTCQLLLNEDVVNRHLQFFDSLCEPLAL